MAGAAGPAHADFFDDARRLFTKDMPRTFERDIPQALGITPKKTPYQNAPVAGKPKRLATKEKFQDP